MRKSFEKYIRENSSYFQKKSHFLGYKKYIIGFIFGLFFVGTFSYAAPVINGGTIGGLFGYFKNKIENGYPKSNIYRLDGENIEDNTVTSYEIKDGEIKTADIGNLQVTKSKLANNSVDSDKIINGSIQSMDVGLTFTAPFAGYANNSDKLDNRDIETVLSGNNSKIPTSKAVKDYIKLLRDQMTTLETKIRILEKTTAGRNCIKYACGSSFVSGPRVYCSGPNHYGRPHKLEFKHRQIYGDFYEIERGLDSSDRGIKLYQCLDGRFIDLTRRVHPGVSF